MSLSQAPLSTPMVDRQGRLDPNWNKYFLYMSTHLERSTTPKRIAGRSAATRCPMSAAA